MKTGIKTVEEYIAAAPEPVRPLLETMRRVVRENAPGAAESIAYGMPAYKYNGKPLVYFAAFSGHIGFYATPTGHSRFEKELAGYKQGKGSVQFPLKDPLPLDLIARIVRFRLGENEKK